MKNQGKLALILGTFALIAGVFATNVADAKPKGKKAGYLGVTTQAVDSDMAEAFKLTVKYGAIVNTVYEDSPAEKAGIEEDDVIIAVNGKRISDEDDLTDEIRSFDEGEAVTVSLMRDGKQMDVKATLAGRTTSRTIVRNPGGRLGLLGDDDGFAYRFDDNRPYGYIGVSMVGLTEQLATYFGVNEGVLISEVEEDSPAQKAGLKAGDIITHAGADEIEEAEDLSRIIRSKDEDEKVELSVSRKGSSMKFTVTVEERQGSDFWGLAPEVEMPSVPSVPHVRGLHRTPRPDVWYFDSDDNRRDRRSLQREMERLQREMQELQSELEEESREAEREAEKDDSR